MKHLLNNLTEEEKNSIREQHKGGMNVVTENFLKLIKSKSGNVKPLVNEGVLNEQSQTKISTSAEELLKNTSSEINTSIGVKNLPAGYSAPSNGYGDKLYTKEIDWVIDQMDFPVNNDNIGRLLRYLEGSGIPGSFGGSYKNLPIEKRVFEFNGLWYPAVEALRAEYNADESFETLYSEISKKEFTDSKSKLIYAYQKWIDVVNKSNNTTQDKKLKTNQQNNTDCLLKAGFKKIDVGGINNIGYKMPGIVYTGVFNGKKTSLNPNGSAGIDNGKEMGKWKCENGKLVIFDIKKMSLPTKRPF